jgi:hypothetical protein
MRSRFVAGSAGLLLALGLLGAPLALAAAVPALPGSPTAVAISSSQIQFTWTENSTQTNFQVTDGVSYVTLAATARSYTWSGLAPNTYKCSAVRAYNSSGSSAWTSWACTSSLPAVPAVPGNVTASAPSSSQINVTWTENSNQTGFQVSDGVSTYNVGSGVRSYSWTGLAGGTYKCTHVRAYNAGGYSAWTNWACVTTPVSVPVPAMPTNVVATPLSSSQINVTWVENSNQTGFQVTDGVTTVNVGASVRNYTWSGLAGSTYKCTAVRAYNGTGYSAWTGWACTSSLPSTVPQPLAVPYLSQYQGQGTQNVDCGPAAVAMVLQYRNLRPANLTNQQFVSQVRTQTGASDTGCDNGGPCGTGFGQLEAALTYYGATWSEVPASLSPAPDAQVTAVKNALAAGKPVIAFVHGADLGRGDAYGDHWFVVTGFSSDGNTAYINDPDNQGARWDGWIVGGVITLPTSTLRTAMYDAAPGPYAIIVN